MAIVSYNGQSISIDGRRIWVLGASIQYARTHPAHWADRINAARQAGFNTIETACPWLLHEPRKGRFHFEHEADLKQFIKLCGKAGMKVILRVGPFVGSQFDGGGLPGWLIEQPGVVVREDNELFLEHVSRYLRRLLTDVAPLQVTNGGPVLLVQAEHAWDCSNDQQGQDYLGEITRFIRENGITVPITNANDLWQEPPGTISTWRGWADLLVHLRQLRSVHSKAPRLVSAFEAADPDMWGNPPSGATKSPSAVLSHLAEILAAGAQPVVSPFHGGTNFAFMGGRIAGLANGFVTTSAAANAPLTEDGLRGHHYHAIRRLITFANHFGHVFAEVDPEYSPIVLDTATIGLNDSPSSAPGKHKAKSKSSGTAVVHLRGAQGQIVFVFADASTRSTSLVLEDGVRLPVNLGDQAVGWFVLDVDLHGSGRLEYANLCPWAVVDRSIVVLHGPERSHAYLSIDGTPLEATVPALGGKPVVLEQGDLTIVICNQAQIDATYHDEKAVLVGVSGFDSAAKPMPAAGFPTVWRITANAKVEELKLGADRSRAGKSSSGTKSFKPAQWQACGSGPHVTGASPRFASLEGPQTLVNCGAVNGYGWYRLRIPRAAGRSHMCHLPQAADRAHLYVGGKLQRIDGAGPGARHGSFNLKLEKDDPVLVALVDNLGRFAEGNQIAMPKGLCGHVYAVKPIRSARPKIGMAKPVNPFVLRGYIAGRASTQLSDSRQVIWTFNHPKKTPIIIEVINAVAAGTFVLNDHPVAYCAGSTGGMHDSILIEPEMKGFKRGRNVLRFAPDSRADGLCEEIAKRTSLYDCTENLTDNAQWAFARWEPPAVTSYAPVAAATMRKIRGAPCWWRGEVMVEPQATGHQSLWLDTIGLTKGQAFINGQNLGRYFTATADGRPVGPQTRLYIPEPWVRHGLPNEVVLFDEHGASPARVRLFRNSG